MSPTFPRGIEVLLKKAAVDPEFRALLLDAPEQAAESIALELNPVERSMLKTMPPEQLTLIVERTEVPQPQRRAFLGTAAAAMLAALTGVSSAQAGDPFPPRQAASGGHRTAVGPPGTEGLRPIEPEKPAESGWGQGSGYGGIRPDGVRTAGIRPDVPQRKKSVPERVRELVLRELGIDERKLTASFSWRLNRGQLWDFRQAIYDEFDVRMPARVLHTLDNVEKLTAYIDESLAGYKEKTPDKEKAKPGENAETPPVRMK